MRADGRFAQVASVSTSMACMWTGYNVHCYTRNSVVLQYALYSTSTAVRVTCADCIIRSCLYLVYDTWHMSALPYHMTVSRKHGKLTLNSCVSAATTTDHPIEFFTHTRHPPWCIATTASFAISMLYGYGMLTHLKDSRCATRRDALERGMSVCLDMRVSANKSTDTRITTRLTHDSSSCRRPMIDRCCRRRGLPRHGNWDNTIANQAKPKPGNRGSPRPHPAHLNAKFGTPI